jgi:hypothetical protein
MKTLKLAEGVSLPIEAVTQAIAILAKRRVGKSYTGRRLAEQLLKAGQQVVIVDPKGDHWGIRSGADGKSPGLPVVILGGEHGDVPLEVGSGEIIAKLAAEERVSMLLDLSLFRKHELATFMTAFLENLYRLKAREAFRTPLFLMIDEADAIAPQKPQPNEARMLGAAEDIVRRGGQRGLGCGLITQRSAVLNKNVLTQVEMIIALRTISPQDLDALDAWVEVHGTKEQREALMTSLPSLPVGDAWFWSPGWPTEKGIFQRSHVLPIETFDSGASPKAGEKRVEPKNLADVDLTALTKQMAATIENKKQNDPKELKRRIKELELALAKQPVAVPQKGPTDNRAVERAVKEAERGYAATSAKLRRALEAAMKFIINVSTQNFDVAGVDKAELEKAVLAAVGRATQLVDQRLSTRQRNIEQLRDNAQRLVASLKAALDDDTPVEINVAVQRNEPFTVSAPKARPPAVPRVTDGSLSGAQQKILDAIATLNELGVEQPTLVQVALFVGVSHTTGSYQQNVRNLADTGYLERRNGQVALTVTGRAAAQPDVDRDPIEFWKQKLPGAQSKLLGLILDNAPISREQLAEKAGVSHTTGSFQQNLRDMRTYGIIEIESGQINVSELLSPHAYA